MSREDAKILEERWFRYVRFVELTLVVHDIQDCCEARMWRVSLGCGIRNQVTTAGKHEVNGNGARGYGSFNTLSLSQANMIRPIVTTSLKEWSSSTPTLLSNRALRLGQRRGEGALTTDGWAMMSVIKCIRPFMKARDGVEAPGRGLSRDLGICCDRPRLP